MTRTQTSRQALPALLTAILVLVLPATLARPALAGHPTNMIEKHPTATGIAAGIGTHAALKAAAARDKARGKKLNFAERHPTLAGVGAGMLTHHEIKKHTPQ